MLKFALLCFTAAAAFAQKTVIVRPVEVDDVLVNPEMGIQTFQRSNGDPINPGSRWSEAGPSTVPAAGPGKPDFPESSNYPSKVQLLPCPCENTWRPALGTLRFPRNSNRLPQTQSCCPRGSGPRRQSRGRWMLWDRFDVFRALSV